MARQNITFTEPDDDWSKKKHVAKKEYSSKSELGNELIRQTRSQQVETDQIKVKS